MEWLTYYLAEVWLVSGMLLLLIEVLILGFSTFYLMFFGLAAIATAGLFYLGWLPLGWLNGLLATAVLTGVFAAVLWQPLKRLQGGRSESPTVTSDLVGMSFTLNQAISPGRSGSYRYSGVEWQVVSELAIDSGSQVEVVRVDVGKLTVKPQETS